MIRNGTTLPGRSPAHQEVVRALDQACAIWGLAGGNGRSRFIQHCLRYGLLSLLDAGVLELPEAADLNSCAITAKWRHGSRPPAPSQSSNRRPWFPRNRTEGLSTRGGAVPAVASPASVVAGASGIKAAICARRLALSERFREFRPRSEKSDPAPQHPRNLRNRMLRHLACQHSGGDSLYTGALS